MKENRDFRKGSKEAILSFVGVLKNKNINWDNVRKNMQEFRDEVEERFDETARYMEKSRKHRKMIF